MNISGIPVPDRQKIELKSNDEFKSKLNGAYKFNMQDIAL